MWSEHLRGQGPESRGPGWRAQVPMASVIRSDAAALGHHTRLPGPGTPDRLDHQTLVVRPAHRPTGGHYC
ncbi:hypothetical protein N7468_004651 [Penicillium chermesinum]|uniref:Uncharacterized protein n=1 Tax=Penicillium chermesinum TaxID=63820 RepID=A0A9W9P906_9EURO|nr:uncharacterized protein N7468_004651 [Penicillium chermesinum]KAJ5240032.1 hypothetical protein N7468_004651 [Penicillium chermesinum]